MKAEIKQRLGRVIEISSDEGRLYYKFDYDTRSFDVNMEFQHFHDFYELFIPLEEDTGHLIEGDMHTLLPFDIVLLRPGVLHKTHYPPTKPKKRLIINFAFEKEALGFQTAYEELFSLFNRKIPIYRFQEEVSKALLQEIEHIFELSKEAEPLRAFAIHHQFMSLLYKLYTLKDTSSYIPQEKQDSITSKVYSITSFIHHNYEKELSLQQIADQFFISPYYLSHQFKKITGFTLVQYIQMTRIKNAEHLLLATDLNITVIAQQCGFTSFSQFNRVFNKFCHQSPSQFRLKAKESE